MRGLPLLPHEVDDLDRLKPGLASRVHATIQAVADGFQAEADQDLAEELTEAEDERNELRGELDSLKEATSATTGALWDAIHGLVNSHLRPRDRAGKIQELRDLLAEHAGPAGRTVQPVASAA